MTAAEKDASKKNREIPNPDNTINRPETDSLPEKAYSLDDFILENKIHSEIILNRLRTAASEEKGKEPWNKDSLMKLYEKITGKEPKKEDTE